MMKMDPYRWLPQLKLSGKQQNRLRLILSLCIAIGSFLMKKHFDFTWMGTLILIYFGWALLWKISSRWSAFLALVFLASCPAFLFLEKENVAETMAVQAYYLLVVTVILQIVELNSGEKEGEKPGLNHIWSKTIRYCQSINGKLQKIHTRLKLVKPSQKKIEAEKKVEKGKAVRKDVNMKKRTIYILLASFLVLELGVVFFNLPLMVGISGYLFILTTLFPKKAWKSFFLAEVLLLIISLVYVVTSQKEMAMELYLWMLIALLLIAWSWLIEIFLKWRQKKRKS